MTAPERTQHPVVMAGWLRDLGQDPSPAITPTVLAVAAMAATFGSEDGTAIRPSRDTLAALLHTSPDTVKRSLSVLVRLGWFDLVKPGKHGSAEPVNLYRWTWPARYRQGTGAPSVEDYRQGMGAPSGPPVRGRQPATDGARVPDPTGHGCPTTSTETSTGSASVPTERADAASDDGAEADANEPPSTTAVSAPLPVQASDEDPWDTPPIIPAPAQPPDDGPDPDADWLGEPTGTEPIYQPPDYGLAAQRGAAAVRAVLNSRPARRKP